jgi:hypothetical protein
MATPSAFLSFLSTLSGAGFSQLNQIGVHIPVPVLVSGPPYDPANLPLRTIVEQDEEEDEWEDVEDVEGQGVNFVSMASLSSSIRHELHRRWQRVENENEHNGKDQSEDEDVPSSPPPLRMPTGASSTSSDSILRAVTPFDVFGSGSIVIWSDEEAEPSHFTTPPDAQVNRDILQVDQPKVRKWMGKTKQLLSKLRPTHAHVTKRKPSPDCRVASPPLSGDPFRRLRGVPEPENDAVVRQRLMDAHDYDSKALEVNVQVELAVARRLFSGTTPVKEKEKWWKLRR